MTTRPALPDSAAKPQVDFEEALRRAREKEEEARRQKALHESQEQATAEMRRRYEQEVWEAQERARLDQLKRQQEDQERISVARPDTSKFQTQALPQQSHSPDRPPSSLDDIEGVATIVDGATLRIEPDHIVKLIGVRAAGREGATEPVQAYISRGSGTVSCKRVKRDLFRCVSTSTFADIGGLLIRNGAALAHGDPQENYDNWEKMAKAKRKGVWGKSR